MKLSTTTAILALVWVATNSQASLLVWNNGGPNGSFETATNYVGPPALAPQSGVDSVRLDPGVGEAFLNSEFTIASGQSMTTSATGGVALRLGTGADLTIASGSTLDFKTAGNGYLAENGDANVKVTIESGATARVDRFFDASNWTTKFVAGATGVTTFEASDLYLRGGTLEVDLSNYDLMNGTELVLWDYNILGNGGTYGAVNLTGLSGTIDYAYDIGGGDLGIAITNIVVPEPSSTLLLSSVLGLFSTLFRRRRRLVDAR